MDIHDLTNNLGEQNITSDNITLHHTNINKTDDRNNITLDIHPTKEYINNLLNQSRIKRENKMMMNKRQNEIMRNVRNHIQNKSIDEGKNILRKLRHTTISNTVIQSHNKNLNIKSNDVPINDDILINDEHPITFATQEMPDFTPVENTFEPLMNVEFFPESINENSLTDIVRDILKEVISGKITTIENIIGELRTSFEEKNVFKNANKQKIILLNFEDDTTKPVLEIKEKYMNIVNKWYEDCNLILDVEQTDVYIPESITYSDISGVLFQDINYKHKDKFLYNYLPLIINNIISNRTIKEYERIYFLTTNNSNKDIIKMYDSTECDKYKTNNIQLYKLGIKIPDNINSEPNLNDKNPIFSPSNVDNRISFSSARIDSEIHSFSKNILDKPGQHILDNSVGKDSNIFCYNHFFNNENNNLFTEYIQPYNILYPNFGDTCEIINDTLKNDKNNKNSLIVVMINIKSLQTIRLETINSDVSHVIKNHPEFGFINLFSILTNNEDIIQFIDREFNKIQFNDIEEINIKLLVVSQYIDFYTKHINTNNITISEENEVKKYISSNYTINNNIINKMKAATLHDMIVNSKCLSFDQSKINGFKTRLSKYLKDLGLQKKRYNDGFYYYGIYSKFEVNNKLTLNDFKNIVYDSNSL